MPSVRARAARKEPTGIQAVTLVCCPACRLRFTPAAAAYIVACPECGGSPQPIASPELTLGFRLVGPEDLPHQLPPAAAVPIAFASTEPGRARS
jgi:hypothetical protein